jgi:hypothetical protein
VLDLNNSIVILYQKQRNDYKKTKIFYAFSDFSTRATRRSRVETILKWAQYYLYKKEAKYIDRYSLYTWKI